MSAPNHRDSDAEGLAALSICESLALALAEEGILSKEGLCIAIEDSVSAHREAAKSAHDPAVHYRAALIAERIKKSIAAAVINAKHGRH